MKKWKEYKLGSFLKRRYDNIEINDFEKYKRITIRTKGLGIELRDEVLGVDIGTKNQFMVRHNQFLLSKIDALNGAFGIVPDNCDGGIITGNFWVYDLDESILLKDYLYLLCLKQVFTKFSIVASEGTTNRKYLREDKFLNLKIILPPVEEQVSIVSKVGLVVSKLHDIEKLRAEQSKEIDNFLFSTYTDLIERADWVPMKLVAPIVRRTVAINDDTDYPEVGVRCFGKGTFHKPTLSGVDVGTKKIFQIKEGDLIFSNVFAWEGGIAVAKQVDDNRYGSHRFISCLVNDEQVLPEYLLFHFLSPKGLQDINSSSPGGAGRNKTLGLDKLMKISVPIPPIELQREFVATLEKTNVIKEYHKQADKELTDLIPSLLDKVFKGEFSPAGEIEIQQGQYPSTPETGGAIPIAAYGKNDDLELAMIIALIESKLGNTYGEVGIQKTVYNIEAFYPTLNKKYDFVNYHYGTYSAELRDKIKNSPFLSKKMIKGCEVFVIAPSYKTKVLDAITDNQNRDFVVSVNNLLEIYKTPFINKETDKIELLNTVTKLIKDLKTSDVDVIYQGMKQWKVKQAHFDTKADKFNLMDTQKTIELIESIGFISRLQYPS